MLGLGSALNLRQYSVMATKSPNKVTAPVTPAITRTIKPPLSTNQSGGSAMLFPTAEM